MAKKEETAEEEGIKIVIDGKEYSAKKREFKSGRKGYGVYGTQKILDYPHRISLNIIEL